MILINFFIWLGTIDAYLSPYGIDLDKIYRTVLNKIRDQIPKEDFKKFLWKDYSSGIELEKRLKKSGFWLINRNKINRYHLVDCEILIRIGWRLYISIGTDLGGEKRQIILYKYTGKIAFRRLENNTPVMEMEYLYRSNRLCI